MQPFRSSARLDASVSVATPSRFPIDSALAAVCTALCLLALSVLITPASFGPLGALMLLVLAVGVGKALRVPLSALRAERRLRPARTPAEEGAPRT